MLLMNSSKMCQMIMNVIKFTHLESKDLLDQELKDSTLVLKISKLRKKDERFSRNKSTDLTIIGNSIDGLSERIKVKRKNFL